MNPFDLPGPQFLLFYFVFAVLVVTLLVVARRAIESGPAPRLDLSDPYLIACLRGGREEALRVATISLVDRGLLEASGSRLKRSKRAALELARRPLERAILDHFAVEREAKGILKDAAALRAVAKYEAELETQQLLPDPAIRRMRRLLLLVSIALLAGVAGTKIMIALARGRTNVLFLIALAVIAIVVAVKKHSPRLTARGAAMIEDLQNLYAGLRARAADVRAGGATVEAAMLAAVFGTALLPGAAFAFAHTLFPRPPEIASTSSSSSCRSYCSSSTSCGSSCGGGGCGGGCGGCGS